jgi:hypothetical protein
MFDPASVMTLQAAKDACAKGLLRETLLLPEELGGTWRAENIVHLPPTAWRLKDRTTDELIDVVHAGMVEVSIVPTYRGACFVPATITITAAHSASEPAFLRTIIVW